MILQFVGVGRVEIERSTHSPSRVAEVLFYERFRMIWGVDPGAPTPGHRAVRPDLFVDGSVDPETVLIAS
jgi:hypothetical protein